MNKLEYVGIRNWKDFTGKGINVGTMEAVNVNRILDYKVINGVKEGAKHGSSTALTCLETAPGITLHSIPYQPNDPKIIEYVKDNNIDIIFASLIDMPYDTRITKELRELGVTFVMGAGNKGNLVPSRAISSGEFITIGSCGIDKRGRLYNIELEHNYIDFVHFGSVAIPHHDDRDFMVYFNGVSYATPIFAGIVARVFEAFVKHTGCKPTQIELYKFMQSISENGGLAAHKVGNGLPILPNPNNIDYDRYITKPKNNDDIKEEVAVAMDKFKDVKDGRYSTESIYKLVELGLMSGYPDGTFKPKSPISREDFAVVINRLFELYIK